MSAAEITEALQTHPTHSHEKGMPVSTRNPSGPVRETCHWSLNYSGSDEDIDIVINKHLEKMVDFIEEKQPTLNELLLKCEICLWLGFASPNGQCGFVVGSELLKRVTVLPIDIIFDLYPPPSTTSE
jgi:hypothetical protein